MLEELNVRNYALIDTLSASFERGLTILTGETGAGKSIIVGALSFLLGAKADTTVIRTGSEEASVSAVVSISEGNRDVLTWLTSRDIEAEDRRIIVRRSIKTNGRSSIYIQDVPVTRNDLEEFMALLFDLHGQHSHESLLRKESHRKFLDRFAGLEEEAAAFNRIFTDLADKRKALDGLLSNERDRDARLELLRYAVEEIDKAAVKSGESRDLEIESRRLASFEKLAGHMNAAGDAFFDGETSGLDLIRRARSSLEAAAAIDSDLGALQQRMADLYYEAEDLAEEFRGYRDGLRDEPGRLEEVEERLALLYRLRKKYGSAEAVPEEDGILAYKAEAEAEIEALSNAGENRGKLSAEIALLEKEIAQRAAALGEKRRAASLKLGERITGILTGLGMPNARFAVGVNPKVRAADPEGEAARGQGRPSSQQSLPGRQASLVIGPWGAEDVEFLISANTGEPVKDLSRIASGGELSRVMLAIKTVLAGTDSSSASFGSSASKRSADSQETLVFDEIDTGIGGEVALAVGEYLSKIGKIKQIFCVTHLASIAVRADNNLKVEKKTSGGRTATSISMLSADALRKEIARMLAGDAAGTAALAHADELLAKYRK
ncbi:DNA repair protein RecN [Treponema primitia ZAS-2]|uniref:DNA repair protein RecN n=1 Tax=Treponema primitia (strain ATCC BAA-887 / DSM 12427 / ZAS-2) TaxID=545694 RepID=F5YP67_TREPZ|nr:DNA repair protein RecN [Treponema primitia]AEF85556.1 DNA repair protein RecN [Treponema primitia ZAS-2]